MGRIEDLPEGSSAKEETLTSSWEEVLAETRASEFPAPLRTIQAEAGVAADMARELRRSRDWQQRRSARSAAPRLSLESRIAALEREATAMRAEMATLQVRMEQGLATPVASLVAAGHIAEARQLVGFLAQTSPTPLLEGWSRVLAPPVVHSENQATGSPLAPNAEWLRKNAGAHAGRWVALREGTLVDEDPSRVILQRRLEQANTLEGVTFVRL